MPWLVAALSQVSGTDPAAPELIEASAGVAPESPAYWTVVFDRNRLRIEAGDKLGARAELEALIGASPSGILKSSMNRFRSLQMRGAPDLAGFLNFAQRPLVMVTTQLNTGESPDYYGDSLGKRPDLSLRHWDRDSIKILNERTPLALWKTAAQSDQTASHLRQEFVLATFARATLLDDDQAIQCTIQTCGLS